MVDASQHRFAGPTHNFALVITGCRTPIALGKGVKVGVEHAAIALGGTRFIIDNFLDALKRRERIRWIGWFSWMIHPVVGRLSAG